MIGKQKAWLNITYNKLRSLIAKQNEVYKIFVNTKTARKILLKEAKYQLKTSNKNEKELASKEIK